MTGQVLTYNIHYVCEFTRQQRWAGARPRALVLAAAALATLHNGSAGIGQSPPYQRGRRPCPFPVRFRHREMGQQAEAQPEELL